MNRRHFLTLSAVASAAGFLPRTVLADVGTTSKKGDDTVFTTDGDVGTWLWEDDYFKFPNSSKGFGGDTHAPCAVDDQLFVGHTGPEGITVFDLTNGKYRSASDFKFGGLKLSATHGLTSDGKFLYITTNTAGPKNPGRIIKTDLKGEKVWEAGMPAEHSGSWNPTEVTVIDADRVLLTNGYGSGKMYFLSTKDGSVSGSLFSEGSKLGEIKGCHGVMWDKETKLLWLHDRGNRRIQWSDLNGKCSEQLADNGKLDTPLRMPCGSAVWKEFVVVPDLEGRFDIFHRGKGELPGGYRLVGQFGDAGIRSNSFGDYRKKPIGDTVKAGQCGTPHYYCFTQNGDIIAAEWHPTGRVKRLRRVS